VEEAKRVSSVEDREMMLIYGNRKTLISVFVLILFILSTPAFALADAFKVTRVIDGDSVIAVGHDITIEVRLVGIDAPVRSHQKNEPGQPYSKQATKYLAGLVLNKTVDIKGYGQDRYNRVLGVIHLDGKNINLEMVKAGLAEVYRGKPARGMHLGPFWDAEEEAREAKKGMWKMGKKYVSPLEWRREQRRGQT
jgi:micrococcal nuclease